MKLNIPFDPTIKQKAFLKSDAYATAYIAGLGSGKTISGVMAIIMHCLKYPGIKGIAAAPTAAMARDVILEEFKAWCPSELYKLNESKMIVTFINGSKIYFRSAESTAFDKIRGINATFAYIDEAAMISESAYKVILSRTRRQKKFTQYTRIWLTTTPRGRNWIWDYFVKEPKKGYSYVHATTYENPHLDPQYVKDLETSYGGKDSPYYKQEVLASFETFEGAIYDVFNRDIHVVQEVPQIFKKVIVGKDWGFGPGHAGATVFIGLSFDDNWYVIDEIYGERIQVISDDPNHDTWIKRDRALIDKWETKQRDLAKRLASSKIEKDIIIYADSARSEHVTAYRDRDFDIYNADKSVIPGIQMVSSLLYPNSETGKPKLYVYEKCTNVIKEFESYQWKKGKRKEQPDDVNDHAMDCIRYALYSELKETNVIRVIKGFN